MITGVVNAALEASLDLQLYGPTSRSTQTAVIDTGYNGALTLPLAVIEMLDLEPLASRGVTLGDASRRETMFNGNLPHACDSKPLIDPTVLQ